MTVEDEVDNADSEIHDADADADGICTDTGDGTGGKEEGNTDPDLLSFPLLL